MAFAVPVPFNDRRSSHSSSNLNGSFTNSNDHWGNSSFQSQTVSTVADEATIDRYARQVLEDASPPDVSVDAEHLGPYLTSVLRAEQVTVVEDLPDYDNLLELLEEHCSMTPEDASVILQKIALAVATGTIPGGITSFATMGSPTVGLFASPPTGGGMSALRLLETVNMEEATALRVETAASALAEPDNSSGGGKPTYIVSPMRPNSLIPVDLLGAIDAQDENGTGDATALQMPPPHHPPEEEFPSLAVAAKTAVTKKAARSSRSRQGSIDESSIPSDHSTSQRKVSPNLQPTPVMQQQLQQPYYYTLDDTEDPATLLQMACDMLTHMSPDMGQDAIFHAATAANGDVGVAQYLMDCALSAPPVCRHLLHSGCYRSDCQFSHDLEGHTCVFWLRGHCNKGKACPFLHGYNERWLVQLLEHQQADYYYKEESWEQPASGRATADATQTTTTTRPLSTCTNSFANIASKGYNDQTCFRPSDNGTGHLYVEEAKLAMPVPNMKIPQDVWNPHERRDSSAFRIADPMERYREVSRHTARTDVIDLHFQSTKTFSQVLEQVLPDKLEETGGLWIVTGTGHHVGSKTHQKGGGVLESAVQNWLAENGYDFWKGRDRNGHGGAVFVKQPEEVRSIQQ